MAFSHMSLEVFIRLRRLGLGVRRPPVSPGDGSIKKIPDMSTVPATRRIGSTNVYGNIKQLTKIYNYEYSYWYSRIDKVKHEIKSNGATENDDCKITLSKDDDDDDAFMDERDVTSRACISNNGRRCRRHDQHCEF